MLLNSSFVVSDLCLDFKISVVEVKFEVIFIMVICYFICVIIMLEFFEKF